MKKAIIWKEFKRSWKLSLVFLLASIVIPFLVELLMPFKGPVGIAFLCSIWIVFALFIGFRYERRSHGPLSFLHARPATRPFVATLHCLSLFLFLVILIAFSLGAYLLSMTQLYPEFLAGGVLFDPDIMFILILCLSAFSFAVFISASAATFTFAKVGLVFVSLTVLGLVFRNEIFAMTSGFPPIDKDETPLLFIATFCALSLLFLTLSLWEVAFIEVWHAKNRRWRRAATLISCVAFILLAQSGLLLARASQQSGTEIVEVITTPNSSCPIVALVPDGKEFRPITFTKVSSLGNGKIRRRNKEEEIPFDALHATGRFFQTIDGNYDKAYIAYLSEKPVWGKQIRVLDLQDDTVSSLSEPSLRYALPGIPYRSPDEDRIAYLVSSGAAGGEKSQALWITKFGLNSISDHCDLGASPGVVFEPIGWTPDGYDFLLKRRSQEAEEIWAVDWLAQKARPFLEDFPNGIITLDDLAASGALFSPIGEWISLVQPLPDQQKYILWLVNYRSNEKIKVGIYNEIPLCAWEDSGEWFSCWSRGSGLKVYRIKESDTISGKVFRKVYRIEEQPITFQTLSNFPDIYQMKWSPAGGILAIVSTAESSQESNKLLLFNLFEGSQKKLIEDFPAQAKQWGWLSGNAIIYSYGQELWQVDTGGEKTFLVSTDSLR